MATAHFRKAQRHRVAEVFRGLGQPQFQIFSAPPRLCARHVKTHGGKDENPRREKDFQRRINTCATWGSYFPLIGYTVFLHGANRFFHGAHNSPPWGVFFSPWGRMPPPMGLKNPRPCPAMDFNAESQRNRESRRFSTPRAFKDALHYRSASPCA